MKDKVIIVTGPAGVGKSTTAKLLVRKLNKSAYIEGDTISHMSVVGREKPWESERANNLVWKNIQDLTKNFINDGCQVVVDWIVFFADVKCYMSELIEKGVEVRYAILWADETEHLERDRNRPEEVQMGERVLILREEFINSGVPSCFYIDNTNMTLDEVIGNILSDSRFIVSNI